MSGKQRRQDDDLVRSDGALVLTFVNTGSRRSPRLGSYADLLAWSRRHGALAVRDVHRFETLAAESPQEAAAAFAVAEELHGLTSTILNRLADGLAPPSAELSDLNVLLTRIVPHRWLVPGSAFLEWDWPADRSEDPHRPLWVVAHSATDLLTSPDYGKVKRCENEACDVLFLAKGPGSPRRWCDSRSCGAPARSRKHYLRVRKPRIQAMQKQHRSGKPRPMGDLLRELRHLRDDSED